MSDLDDTKVELEYCSVTLTAQRVTPQDVDVMLEALMRPPAEAASAEEAWQINRVHATGCGVLPQPAADGVPRHPRGSFGGVPANPRPGHGRPDLDKEHGLSAAAIIERDVEWAEHEMRHHCAWARFRRCGARARIQHGVQHRSTVWRTRSAGRWSSWVSPGSRASATPARSAPGTTYSYSQTIRCFEIIARALEGGGSHRTHRRPNAHLHADRRGLDGLECAHLEFAGDVGPASPILKVPRFADPRWRVEIEAEAVVPD